MYLGQFPRIRYTSTSYWNGGAVTLQRHMLAYGKLSIYVGSKILCLLFYFCTLFSGVGWVEGGQKSVNGIIPGTGVLFHFEEGGGGG